MRNYQKELLDPSQVAICIIDEQPQMFFGVESTERLPLMNAVTGLAKAAQIFQIPVILSTVEALTFSGPLYSKIQSVYPQQMPIDRTTLNAWEDKNFRNAIAATGKRKLLFAGLWTEVCVTLPVLCAIADGYEAYVVTDASAGASKEAHNMAILRMTQAGAKPLTWQAAFLEMQRDWANQETYEPVVQLMMEYGGTYGLGLEYALAMVPQSNA